jgi:hypothetical protein
MGIAAKGLIEDLQTMATAVRAFDTPLRSYSRRTVIRMQGKTTIPGAIFQVSVLHVYRATLKSLASAAFAPRR